MSAHASAGRNRRPRRSRHEHEHPDERWLLTYSDMITLLMALFIVLWAISSVNTSKYAALRVSLKEAFNGKMVDGGEGILPGGRAVLEAEGARLSHVRTPREAPDPVSTNRFSQASAAQSAAQAAADVESLARLEVRMESYAENHGLEGVLQARLSERGLVVRLLTDEILFASGDAVVQSEGVPLLRAIARLIEATAADHPIRVEGHTDPRPIATSRFPSNWELSASRATAVLQILRGAGVPDQQLSVAGYAAERPVASNGDEAGRTLNRRVEIVVLRRSEAEGGSS